MSSILNDVKSYCQVESDDDSFDNDIITLANAFLDDCKQVGVGDDDFELSDAETTWEDFVGEESAKQLHRVSLYVKIKTKLAFDPPANSALAAALDKEAQECICRMNYQVDPKPMVRNKD